ncbi:hypothetical protein EDC15_10471 [Acetobacter aceti NBRC 14818]|nr:hypothetical protein EDC15_10471 [Acetobacter aceti NBRC 14818]
MGYCGGQEEKAKTFTRTVSFSLGNGLKCVSCGSWLHWQGQHARCQNKCEHTVVAICRK